MNTLLEQDRVRAALEQAEVLTQRYRGPEAELAHGWALLRNGDFRAAEARFRRAAEAGAEAGHAGLAAILASNGRWPEAVDSARRALAGGERVGAANAVLAGAAWNAGDAPSAATQLVAWSEAEAGTARGRAAAAMAAAVGRIVDAPNEWRGEPTVMNLQQTAAGGWAIALSIEGQPVVMRLDLTFRQSVISNRVATRLDLAVDGGAATGVARSATSRWPGLLVARQTLLQQLDFGDLALRNVVFAVSELPQGVDGVIGADLLTGARWSLSVATRELVLAPPDDERPTLPGAGHGRAVAWLSARVPRQGLVAQLLFFPRVDEEVVPAGLDPTAASRLDAPTFVVPPGDSSAPLQLMLGGWEEEVLWRPASLTGWAIDGGIAPRAVLGSNVFEAWALHWYPRSLQLRIDRPDEGVGLP